MFVADAIRAAPPLAAGVSLGIRYCLGDAMIQSVTEDSVDFKRAFSFASFGFCWGVLGAYPIYSSRYGYELLFAGVPKIRKAVYMTTFDNCIQSPLLYFPMFYIVRESILSESVGTQVLAQAAAKYRAGIVSDVQALWMVWGPPHPPTS